MIFNYASGRIFIGIALLASGFLQLFTHNFVRLVPKLPAWIPSPVTWAVLSGVGLIGIGAAITVDRQRRMAAYGLAGLFLVVLLLRVPEVVGDPAAGFRWTNPCKALAMLGGALLLAAVPGKWSALAFTRLDSIALKPTQGAPCISRPDARLRLVRPTRLCAVLLGVFLVVCGVQHFIYDDFVIQMVPAWLPGQRFWAHGTGIALIAGGVGMNFRPTARLAAGLSGLMIFFWVVLLHIPRALASWPDAGEIAGVFEALGLSGISFLVAEIVSEKAPPTTDPS